MMKMLQLILSSLLLLSFLACQGEPALPEKETAKKPAQTQKSTVSKKKVTQKKSAQKRSAQKKTASKKVIKKKVAKKRSVKKTVKKSSTKTLIAQKIRQETSLQTLPLITPKERVIKDDNRHLYIIGDKLAPLSKSFSHTLAIKKGQTQKVMSLNDIFVQEFSNHHTLITMMTLGDFFKEKDITHTLQKIENLPTKKSFFIIFYNYEKNLLPLLDNKLLNGLKNVLLFMPLSHKTSIQNEPSVRKLLQSLRANNVTFKQLQDSICDHHPKECKSHLRGNEFLLY